MWAHDSGHRPLADTCSGASPDAWRGSVVAWMLDLPSPLSVAFLRAALSSIQPPSLQQPVYSGCLMRVREKGPSCLIIPILPSLKNHHSSRASQGGWGREHVLCVPSHPFTTGTDPEIHFPTNFVQANLWGRVCSPGSLTPSILQSSECVLKMQMTGLDPRPAELISRGGGWNLHY